MVWVWVWLVGCPVTFFVLALGVKAGQHGAPGWPYLLPLMIAGVVSGVLCSLLAYNTHKHNEAKAHGHADAPTA